MTCTTVPMAAEDLASLLMVEFVRSVSCIASTPADAASAAFRAISAIDAVICSVPVATDWVLAEISRLALATTSACDDA